MVQNSGAVFSHIFTRTCIYETGIYKTIKNLILKRVWLKCSQGKRYFVFQNGPSNICC